MSLHIDSEIERITYILQGVQFGIEPRYCVLGLGEVSAAPLDKGGE